jgi:hypothetical protein
VLRGREGSITSGSAETFPLSTGSIYLPLTQINRGRNAGLLECVLTAQE